MGAAFAAFIGRHEEHGAAADRLGRGVAGDAAFEGGQQIVDGFGRCDGLGQGRRELVVRALGDVLGTVGFFRGQELFEVDGDRGAVGLGRLEGDRRPAGNFQAEAHHRLVHAADLFDVKRAVAEPLAVEDQELFEDAVDGVVGDEGGV